MDNKGKYALYCRVSTTLQTTDNQKIRLLQWATNNNHKYELFDETQSTRKTRPIKQMLLQRLRKGDFTAVVVFKLDRWA
jgi:DNA invertase Pin-like site-specific DNA recombinase